MAQSLASCKGRPTRRTAADGSASGPARRALRMSDTAQRRSGLHRAADRGGIGLTSQGTGAALTLTPAPPAPALGSGRSTSLVTLLLRRGSGRLQGSSGRHQPSPDRPHACSTPWEAQDAPRSSHLSRARSRPDHALCCPSSLVRQHGSFAAPTALTPLRGGQAATAGSPGPVRGRRQVLHGFIAGHHPRQRGVRAPTGREGGGLLLGGCRSGLVADKRCSARGPAADRRKKWPAACASRCFGPGAERAHLPCSTGRSGREKRGAEAHQSGVWTLAGVWGRRPPLSGQAAIAALYLKPPALSHTRLLPAIPPHRRRFCDNLSRLREWLAPPCPQPEKHSCHSCTPQPPPGIRKYGHAGPAPIPRSSKHPETASSRVENDSTASRYPGTPPPSGPPTLGPPPPGDTIDPPGDLNAPKKSQTNHLQRQRTSGSLWAPLEPKP